MSNAKEGMDGVVKFVCGSIIVLSAIISIAIYWISDRKLMAQNIETAIAKGIDPLSVRCSYADSKDLICVAFAASAQSHNVAQSISKK